MTAARHQFDVNSICRRNGDSIRFICRSINIGAESTSSRPFRQPRDSRAGTKLEKRALGARTADNCLLGAGGKLAPQYSRSDSNSKSCSSSHSRIGENAGVQWAKSIRAGRLLATICVVPSLTRHLLRDKISQKLTHRLNEVPRAPSICMLDKHLASDRALWSAHDRSTPTGFARCAVRIPFESRRASIA
ncbi:MAG: hypothetical protein ACI87A_002550 [Planctomycetota bacterium]|jgi:hypothetical protein